MATRVKKQPSTSKEVAPSPVPAPNEAAGSVTTTVRRGRTVKSTVNALTGLKKTVQLKATARAAKKIPLKINPKNFARVLMENGKGSPAKKLYLKNGGKEVVKKSVTKPRVRKPKVPKIKQESVDGEEDDRPPILEPMFPQVDNLEVKKVPKKRRKKLLQVPPLIEIQKIKAEPDDDTVSCVGDPQFSNLAEAKVVKKAGRPKKLKIEPSSIDEVMTDLSFLIDTKQLKKEPIDGCSELAKSEGLKVKKLTKKQRLELLKKDFAKREDIENTLSKLEPADFKVIDRLDLNVREFKTEVPRIKRRHSIERFSDAGGESNGESLMSQLSVFSQMPRSLSPKTSRKSLKLGTKRPSPYSTRSDSPARLLRNGKHRKLKDLSLFGGLEGPKRRKRLHSDLSGSETASKLSGYESDSSFSDMASLHGSEKDTELSKPGLDNLLLEDSPNWEGKSSASPPPDLDKPLIDTNSNLCNDDSTAANQTEADLKPKIIQSSESSKVPEKGLLLDIMKQTFNDLSSDKVVSKLELYGKVMEQGNEVYQGEKKDNTCAARLLLDAATSTGDLTIDNPRGTMPEEDELRLLLEQTDPMVNKHDIGESLEELDNIVHNSTSPLITVISQGTDQSNLLDQAPILEKQVLNNSDENMLAAIAGAEPDVEHLEPPVLESSVAECPVVRKAEHKKAIVDDHKIGIAVTEKDNIVLFSIEHLSDDVGDHDGSNEDLNQSFEDKKTDVEEGNVEAVADVDDGKDDSAEVEPETEATLQREKEKDQELNPPKEIIDSLHDSAEPAPESTDQIHEESDSIDKDTELLSSKEICPQTALQSNTFESASQEAAGKENEEGEEEGKDKCSETMETEEHEKTVDETKQLTEEGCDKKNVSEINDNGVKKGIVTSKRLAAKRSSQESAEELAKKESILNALGLQSLDAAKVSPYPKRKSKASAAKSDPYTGTLKTVIKINKKKGKNSLKMTLQKSKSKSSTEGSGSGEGYKIMKESGSSSSKHSRESSDSAGAHRKSHYSNRSNMEGSSEHTSDGEPGSSQDKNQPEKSLIVPEKASSFSIHPGRLCKDECSYCFGKFGLFDTPCHLAQMKSVERQNKILAAEKHLTRDSCLCDACYRHVDRKSNSPSYINKSLKRNSLVAPGPKQNHCHVLGCNNVSSNILRRKWIIKMRKSICQAINIDLDNPGLHSIPICDEHFTALEHLMICAMCKRRLARNHIHYLGPEVQELNEALRDDEIPILLPDKPVVCKLCRCFASIILKDPEERMENSVNFYKEYRKRLLHFNDVVRMDTASAEGPIATPGKSDKKELELNRRKNRLRNSSNESGRDEKEDHMDEDEPDTRIRSRVHSSDTNNSRSANHSRAESPDDGDEYGGVDYNTLIPAIAMECPSDNESKKDLSIDQKLPRLQSLGNAIEISRTYKSAVDKNRSNDLAAQKLGQNPSISLQPTYSIQSNDLWQDGKPISTASLSVRQLFPGEEELGLAGDIDFKNSLGRTPEGWEKCVTTIQYDEETKLLWQELQKPYGSKSSFLRHLVLLEKYFRNGDLILSPTASHHAINYRESVHNRLRAYDNIPTKAGNVQPATMVQFNKAHTKTSGGGITNHSSSNGVPPVTISHVGGVVDPQTSRTPITLQQLNQPPLYSSASVLSGVSMKNKPPGLISINQKAVVPTTFRQQISSQKIKFPITKNWRPNLIPIDPTKKHERKAGLVQVISGGKPYHITLEDYKKMCAIKRSFEAKQKKILEQQQAKQQLLSQNPILKMSLAKKGVITVGKTSGGYVTEGKAISLVPIGTSAPATITSMSESAETILEKLDKQVERLGKGTEPISISAVALENNPAIQIIPKIPKSLTVIPQTVSKEGPVLQITKTSSSASSNGDDSNSQP